MFWRKALIVSMTNFLRGYWKSIVVCICILYFSLLYTPDPSLQTFLGADKIVHLLMYLILGAALTWESVAKNSSALKLYLTAVVFPLIFGGAIELVQYLWLAPRTGDIWDVVVNCFGVLVGFRLVIVISSKL